VIRIEFTDQRKFPEGFAREGRSSVFVCLGDSTDIHFTVKHGLGTRKDVFEPELFQATPVRIGLQQPRQEGANVIHTLKRANNIATEKDLRATHPMCRQDY